MHATTTNRKTRGGSLLSIECSLIFICSNRFCSVNQAYYRNVVWLSIFSTPPRLWQRASASGDGRQVPKAFGGYRREVTTGRNGTSGVCKPQLFKSIQYIICSCYVDKLTVNWRLGKGSQAASEIL